MSTNLLFFRDLSSCRAADLPGRQLGALRPLAVHLEGRFSQMLSKKGMRVYSNLFHVGVLFILAGHFVGLTQPQ